jgi:hypothetical protein
MNFDIFKDNPALYIIIITFGVALTVVYFLSNLSKKDKKNKKEKSEK